MGVLNQKPAGIMTIPSLIALGQEMREAADKYPCSHSPHYSSTEVESIERTKEWCEEEKKEREEGKEARGPEWQWEVGLARAVIYEARSIITICITREDFEKPSQYRLSMCRVTPGAGAFAPVPDLDAALIAACVLGEGVTSVVNPSGIENAKHFVRKIDNDV